MNNTDRRIKPRIELDVIVNCSRDSKSWIKNISEGGMCIRSEKPFDIGIFILADFSLPSEKPIRVISRILWSRPSDSSGFDSGMEFWYIEDEDRHYLGKYIEQEMNAAVDKA
jgi:Tfp pilus assembly protein PilZ